MSNPDRHEQRKNWLTRTLGSSEYDLQSASADASFRSYWRVTTGTHSLILMDAPPTREDCRPFIDITTRLRAVGINAPRIHGQDLVAGFLLLDDLGETPYSDQLDRNSVDGLYRDALKTLQTMQTIDTQGLPDYDTGLLRSEMALFSDWLLGRHLKIEADSGFEQQWQRLQQLLVDNALAQPQVFVHRDYHCRNLMVCPADNPGVIDYQDAVAGPITYDLVSLLRDCYVSWPTEQVYQWAETYRQQVLPHDTDPQTWQRWFDLMGLQRQLKASGIFCRLWHRDGKRGFLKEIPRTLSYARYVTEKYSEINHFTPVIEMALKGFEEADRCEP